MDLALEERKELAQLNMVYVSFMFKEIEKLLSKNIRKTEDLVSAALRAKMLLKMAGRSHEWIDEALSRCVRSRKETVSECALEIVGRALDELTPTINQIRTKIGKYYEEEL